MKYILSTVLSLLLPIVAFADHGGTVHPSAQLENPLAGGANTITEFLVVVLNNLVLPIGAVVIVFMLIYSGFLFVTARGNESELETAKKNFLYVVIGTAVLLGATAISWAIGGTLCQLAPELPGCVQQVGPQPIISN